MNLMTFPDFLRSHGVPEDLIATVVQIRERKMRERGLDFTVSPGMIDFNPLPTNEGE